MDMQNKSLSNLQIIQDDDTPTRMGSGKHVPDWFKKIKESFDSDLYNGFVLYGNVDDLYPLHGALVRLEEYLELTFSHDVVVVLDPAIGVMPVRGFDAISGQFALGKKESTMAELHQFLLELYRLRKEVAPLIILQGGKHWLGDSPDHLGLLVRRIVENSSQLEVKPTIIVLAERLGDLSQDIVGSSFFQKADIRYPSAPAILEVLQDYSHRYTHCFENIMHELPLAADRLAGVGTLPLVNLIKSKASRNEKLSTFELETVKQRLVEETCNGLLEFINPAINLSALHGQVHLKKVIQRDIQIWNEGNKMMIPKGYLLIGPVGNGKAQPLTAKLRTPSGWITMGSAKVGMELVTPKGLVTKITGIYPRGCLPNYKVSFDDGGYTFSSGDHLWSVCSTPGGNNKVLSLNQIIKSRKHGALFTPVAGCVPGKDTGLTLCPRELGMILGSWPRMCGHSNALSALGLANLGLDELFIPDCYLDASVESRQRLLTGFVESSSCKERSGFVYGSFSSDRLARNFANLVRSLGCKAWYTGPKIRDVSVPTFAVRVRCLGLYACLGNTLSVVGQIDRVRKISNVELVGGVPMQCIAIDDPDHLYLTDDFIVTHNTYFVEALAGEANVPVVRINNFRSGTPGETEANLEKIFRMLKSLSRCYVFIDEADQAMGSRQSGSDGSAGRVYSMFAQEIASEANRGKIIWIMATSQPHKLEPDLKRPGRMDLKIPLLPCETPKAGLALIHAMGKKRGLALEDPETSDTDFTQKQRIGNENKYILGSIPEYLTPASAVVIVDEIARKKREDPNARDRELLMDALKDYQPMIPLMVMKEQCRLAVRESSDLRFVEPEFHYLADVEKPFVVL